MEATKSVWQEEREFGCGFAAEAGGHEIGKELEGVHPLHTAGADDGKRPLGKTLTDL